MRTLFFLLVFAFFSGSVPNQDRDIIYRLLIHPTSSITIAGSTNVNKYQCVIGKYTGSDTLLLTAERGKGAYFKKGLVKLEASRFDCEKQVITKDFAETIQATKYPFITINLISFERTPEFKESEEPFRGKFTITLANVSVPCDIRCKIVKDKNNLIRLKGWHLFKFSDFNLDPPTKMMGLIKVEEMITVDFHLVLVQK
jgi:hypothetical protein